MPVLAPLMLLAFLGTCLLAGRIIAAHQLPRPDLRNPLLTFCGGFGAYVLWWLLVSPLLGTGPAIAAGLFMVCTLLLSVGLFRSWQRHVYEAHYRTLSTAVILLALPLLPALLFPAWSGVVELNTAQLINQLGRLSFWPAANDNTWSTYNLPSLASTTPGWLALWLPLQITAGNEASAGPWPALFGLFNGGLLVLLAGQLLLVLHVAVRWSNLLLCAAGSLLALQLALLLGLGPALTGAGPQLFAGACVLAALSPLLRPEALPTGTAALLPALALAALTALHPLGLPLSLLVALCWLLRVLLTLFVGGVFSARGWSTQADLAALPLLLGRHVFAITALVCLPVACFLLWQKALQPFGLSLLAIAPAHPLAWPAHLLLALQDQLEKLSVNAVGTSITGARLLALGGPLGTLFAALWLLTAELTSMRQTAAAQAAAAHASLLQRFTHSVSDNLAANGALFLRNLPRYSQHGALQIFLSQAPLSIPALLAMATLLLGLWAPAQPAAQALSLLLLPVWIVPVWYLFLLRYRRSLLQQAAFARPWALGLVMALITISLGFVQQLWLRRPETSANQHMVALGREIIQQQLIGFGQPVFTLNISPELSAALSLGLAHHAPVRSLNAAGSAFSPQGLRQAMHLGQGAQSSPVFLLADGHDPATAPLIATHTATLPAMVLFRWDAPSASLAVVHVWGGGPSPLQSLSSR